MTLNMLNEKEAHFNMLGYFRKNISASVMYKDFIKIMEQILFYAFCTLWNDWWDFMTEQPIRVLSLLHIVLLVTYCFEFNILS